MKKREIKEKFLGRTDEKRSDGTAAEEWGEVNISRRGHKDRKSSKIKRCEIMMRGKRQDTREKGRLSSCSRLRSLVSVLWVLRESRRETVTGQKKKPRRSADSQKALSRKEIYPQISSPDRPDPSFCLCLHAIDRHAHVVSKELSFIIGRTTHPPVLPQARDLTIPEDFLNIR